MIKSFNLSVKLPLTMVGLVLLAITVIVSVQSNRFFDVGRGIAFP